MVQLAEALKIWRYDTYKVDTHDYWATKDKLWKQNI